MGEYREKKRFRWLFVLWGILLFAVAVLGVLQLGCVYADKSWKQWYPDYAKEDITPLLEKETLSDEEYDFLYRQTGLTKIALDDMRKTESGRFRIRRVHEAFFDEYTVKDDKFAPFTYAEQASPSSVMCSLKNGDIIVTATTRVSWWRYGHAAIVVDGKGELIAEALGPGSVSNVTGASTFNVLADFIVLRPRFEQSLKDEIAAYVLSDMMDIPYHFTAGLFGKKYKKNPKNTHCAHFVWSAYMNYGIDLDSNGGKIVKPQDMALSDQVDVVQVFGFDLDTLWS